MSQQQSQTVQVVQKNNGCLSGCGTVFAVLLVVGLAVAYWYIALPVAVIAIGVFLWYRNQQKQKLPAPKAGPEDAWLNRIAILLSSQGYAEKTRNTGQQLGGAPLGGDLVLEGHRMRLFVNVMGDEDSATQTANRLRANDDFQKGIGRKVIEVHSQGQFVFIARSNVGVIDSQAVDAAVKSVAAVVTVRGEANQLPPATPDDKEVEGNVTRLTSVDTVGPGQQDVLGDIQRLASLRDSGAITDDEFETKKAELLKRL